MQRRLLAIFLSILFFVPFITVQSAESAESPKDLFRFDDVVEISAPVDGDLYVAGREVILRGSVAGDVLTAGGTVTLEGSVAGDARIVGDVVQIAGPIDGNITVVARSFTLTEKARVGKNVTFWGQRVDVAATVGGDVRLTLFAPEEAIVRAPAIIDGVLIVTATTAPTVDAGAIVRGGVTHSPPVEPKGQTSAYLFNRIIAFFSLVLVGIIVVHLSRRPAIAIVSIMTKMPWSSMLWGAGIALAVPIIVIALALTVVGFPLAVIIGALFGVLLYVGRVLTALTIGLSLVQRFDRRERVKSLIVVFVLGAALLILFESIPFFGFAVTLFATLWGLGGIATLLRTLAEHPKLNNQKPAI